MTHNVTGLLQYPAYVRPAAGSDDVGGGIPFGVAAGGRGRPFVHETPLLNLKQEKFFTPCFYSKYHRKIFHTLLLPKIPMKNFSHPASTQNTTEKFFTPCFCPK